MTPRPNPHRRAFYVLLASLALTLTTGHFSLARPDTPAAPEIAPRPAASDSAARSNSLPRFSQIISAADSAVKARGGSSANDAQLFVSWNAPWGSRRAQQVRQPACRDSTVEDTLYLCVLTGRPAERFTGFTGQLLIHATGRDTLGRWWHMEGKGGSNPGSLRVEWAAMAPWAAQQPFRVSGQGFVLLDRTPTTARLRMVYAVPFDQAAPIAADSTYVLARLILKHRPDRELDGCTQPVVIEWASATLAFGPKDEPVVQRGERFVTYSGPLGLLEPYRGSKVQVWKPKP